MIFTEAYRADLQEALISRARDDNRITGVALFGSGAIGAWDRWSDIDLALGVRGDCGPEPVMADWTQAMYDDHETVDHVDVVSGATVYRVFLLDNTLQVDIAFAPESAFGATAPTFTLISGTANER